MYLKQFLGDSKLSYEIYSQGETSFINLQFGLYKSQISLYMFLSLNFTISMPIQIL